MGQGASKVFDLPHQLSFYASYHANPVNQIIHVIGVPTILWSAFVWLSYTKPVLTIPLASLGTKSIDLTWGLAISSAYGMYYTCLDPIAGVGAWAVLYGLLRGASSFVGKYGPDAWKVATAAHVIGWITQFVGHGVFEGRRPALFDNLFQSFVLAPFFVFLEVLFHLGYRPALKKQIANETGKRILAYRLAKAEAEKKAAE